MNWDDWRLLLLALDAGSLSAAARASNISQATLSRRLSRLESDLGQHLVDRSRAGLKLTKGGRMLVEKARTMADCATSIQQLAESFDNDVAGEVTLAVPPGVAIDAIVPTLGELRRRYPALRLRVLCSPSSANLDAGEADIAVRLYRPTQGDLIVSRLGTLHYQVLASPSLIAQLAPDSTLSSLPWITWPPGFEYLPTVPWLAAAVPELVPVFETDDFLVQRAAATAGHGVIIAGPTPGLHPVPVDHPTLPSLPVHLVVRRALVDVPRVATVVGFIREQAEQALVATRG